MKRLLAVAVLIAFAACGNRTEVRLIDRSDLPGELYGDPSQPRTSLQSAHVVLYFVRTDDEGKPLRPVRLAAFSREVESDLRPVELAIRLLLAGPTPEEIDAGVRSAITTEAANRRGTELIGVSVEDGVADVNMSGEFEDVNAQIIQVMRVGQVVWTLTELPDVDSVRFRIHGVPQPVIDQNGVAHEVVGRGRYSRFAPTDSEPAESVGGLVGPDGTDAPG